MKEQHEDKTAKSLPAVANQPQGLVPSRDAGRALDALIAERVMGWTAVERDERGHLRGVSPTDNPFGLRDYVPDFSSRIGAAWPVMEAVRERMLTAEVCATDTGWLVRFDTGAITYEAAAPTAPLAICRAALAAVEAP